MKNRILLALATTAACTASAQRMDQMIESGNRLNRQMQQYQIQQQAESLSLQQEAVAMQRQHLQIQREYLAAQREQQQRRAYCAQPAAAAAYAVQWFQRCP